MPQSITKDVIVFVIPFCVKAVIVSEFPPSAHRDHRDWQKPFLFFFYGFGPFFSLVEVSSTNRMITLRVP